MNRPSHLDEVLERAAVRRNLPHPKRCRQLREVAGLTQADVAAAIGVRATAVSRWEGGTRSPTGSRLFAYAALLKRLEAER